MKFKKRVKAALNKEIAPQVTLMRNTGSMLSVSNGQAWGTFMLYTSFGNTTAANDLEKIFQGIQGAGGNYLATKFRFESGVLDLLLANNANATNDGPATKTAICDVYTVVCRTDVANAQYQSAFEVITNSDALANQDVNADAKITDADIGYTPFSNPIFCKFFKVMKKRTIILSPGQITEMQLRDPKNYTIYGQPFNTKSCVRNMTRGYVICVRGVYEPQGGAPITPAVRVTFAYTRHYVTRQLQESTWTSANK